jgi:poly(A) polymerase
MSSASAPRVYQDCPIPADLLDPDAVKIAQRLRRFGHEAYLVGGCVRDLLLARVPKDFDVATSARPRQVKRLFRNCRIIGRRFKLAHVYFGEKIIEVSTFRKNPTPEGQETGDLLILRDNVFGTAEEDALRRDFTVNALFYDVEQQAVIDFVGGVEDLRQKLLRTIGDPVIRFREDPVRMMRAAEFSARLAMDLESSMRAALVECSEEIRKGAVPRVVEEILQMLSCGAARRATEILHETGILETLLPELDSGTLWEPVARMLSALDQVDGGKRRHSDAVLLGAIFLPAIRRAAEQRGGALRAAIDAVFRPFAQRMSLSRRNASRTEEVLLALPKFDVTGRGRRFRPARFVNRAYFAESLALYHLETIALGRDLALYAQWVDRQRGVEQPTPEVEEAGVEEVEEIEEPTPGTEDEPVVVGPEEEPTAPDWLDEDLGEEERVVGPPRPRYIPFFQDGPPRHLPRGDRPRRRKRGGKPGGRPTAAATARPAPPPQPPREAEPVGVRAGPNGGTEAADPRAAGGGKRKRRRRRRRGGKGGSGGGAGGGAAPRTPAAPDPTPFD